MLGEPRDAEGRARLMRGARRAPRAQHGVGAPCPPSPQDRRTERSKPHATRSVDRPGSDSTRTQKERGAWLLAGLCRARRGCRPTTNRAEKPVRGWARRPPQGQRTCRRHVAEHPSRGRPKGALQATAGGLEAQPGGSHERHRRWPSCEPNRGGEGRTQPRRGWRSRGPQPPHRTARATCSKNGSRRAATRRVAPIVAAPPKNTMPATSRRRQAARRNAACGAQARRREDHDSHKRVTGRGRRDRAPRGA